LPLLFYADLNKDDTIGQVSWGNKKYAQNIMRRGPGIDEQTMAKFVFQK
jgi:hypothetical protein